mgnify:CR=1 FL=1
MPDKKIPDGYEKHFMDKQDGKVFDVYYNPKEKDPIKAYIKVEVK